jgi:hypothetical protein
MVNSARAAGIFPVDTEKLVHPIKKLLWHPEPPRPMQREQNQKGQPLPAAEQELALDHSLFRYWYVWLTAACAQLYQRPSA